MEFKPLTVDEYLALQFPANDLISSGILTRQSRLVIGGHPGVGKSVLATQTGIEVARGDKWIDTFKAVPSKVLYIQEEIGPKSYQTRLEKVRSHYKRNDGFSVISAANFTFEDASLVQKLKAHIEELKVEIVIFDPLYKIHGRRENDPTELTQLIQVMDRMIYQMGISVVLVHHLRKPFVTYKGEVVSMGIMDFRGATVIPAWADTMVLLEETDVEDKLRLSFPKTRNAPEHIQPVELFFDRVHLRMSPVAAGSTPTDIRGNIIDTLQAGNGGISEGNLVNRMKSKYSKLDVKKTKNIIASMKRDGVIQSGRGGILTLSPKQQKQSSPDPWDTVIGDEW